MAKAKSPAKSRTNGTKKATAKKAVVKKSVTKKSAPPKSRTSGIIKKTTPPPAWNTIHVFGYGESQVIGKGGNDKVPNGELKTIAPLLEHLAKKQQKGTKIKMDALHALNIFNGMFVDFRSRDGENKPQRFAWADVDSKHIDKLADEIKAKIKAAPKKNIKPHKPGERIQALTAKRKSVAVKAKPRTNVTKK